MNTLDRLLEPGRLLGGALAAGMLRDRLGMTELAHGDLLGAFRIERELGRGGMGIVYLAARADGAYEQQVAIKWLPIRRTQAGYVDQFRRERQIHARLSHPHIARLLDGGRSDDGHLWFALEHVEGLPVDRHAADADLGWQARVRLLLPVVEALQFAHGRLLLHRDIKPDNVLVDSDGRPKLIDFGVAALLADADPAAACTPGFASPEQLAGARTDVGSDIWQLGHLLRHVLAAHAPDRLAPAYPGDLAAVIAKATHIAPAQRYPTASALLADLQRVLHYQPVAARPSRLSHRLYLLLRAHPFGTVGSALAVLAFAIMVTGFMLKLTGERDTARHAQVVAETVNAFLNEDFLPGADPLQGGSSNISVAELSERALDKVEPRLHDLPEVAGQVEVSLGRTLANLGRFKAANRAFGQAIKHFTAADGAHGERALRSRLARAQVTLDRRSLESAEQPLQALRADVLASLGSDAELLDEVDAQLARAAFLRDDFAVCESRYSALLPRLAKADPVLLASAHAGRSLCETRLGHWSRALVDARTARALDERALGSDHPATLEAHVAVESALIGLGQYDAAVTALRRLVGQLDQRYGPLHPTTLTMTHDLGLAMTCAGRPEEGAQWLRQAAQGRSQMLGTGHPWYAMTESVLGMALIQSGQLDEAARVLKRARKVLGANPSATPYIQVTLLENEADLALAQRRPAEAIRRFDIASASAMQNYPDGHRRLAMLALGRGLALVAAGDDTLGRALLRQSLAEVGIRPDCRDNQIAMARQLLRH